MSIYHISFKKLLDDNTVSFQMDFDLDEPNQKGMFDCFNEGRCYEPDITALMMRAIKPGDFVIDVGANVGIFTVLMAKLVGDTGMVYAFEPDPDNFTQLVRNIELNHGINVIACLNPVWEKREPVLFHRCADSGGGGALWNPGLYTGNEKTRLQDAEPIETTATTLERVIKQADRRCTFLKVDTEGADEKILSALGPYRPDYIIAESNPFGAKQFGCDNVSMRKLMRSYGYDCFLMTEDDTLPAMVPDNTTLTNGFNGYVYMNLLFSTLQNVGRAYPEAPNIKIPVEEVKR